MYVCLSVSITLINFIFGQTHHFPSDQKRLFDFKNKRPRGLDTLLGHLLVKRTPLLPVCINLAVQRSVNIEVESSNKVIKKLEMHRMTPNWPWTPNSDKYSATTKELPLSLKFWSILLCDHWFSRCKVAPKPEIHWMTPNWTWTLNSQKYSIYTKYLPLRPKFWSVSLYD